MVAHNGDTDVCTVLLEHNANVNKKFANDTALFQAEQNGHVDVCTVLLKNNANINEKL